MPAVSKKQQKFMQAVANSPKFANKVGVNQSVGQEYTKENSMKTKKMNMGGRAMNDRDGSVAMDPKMQMAMAAQQRQAAAGGMATGGMLARTGGSSAKMKAKGKAMKKGGMVKSSASKRADGIAQQGHTRGRIV